MSIASPPPSRDANRFLIILEMIKFEHTVFALPFAIIGALYSAGGIPPTSKLVWIVAAMVGARSAAMSFNRLVDANIDADNPRTRTRALPAGLLKAADVWLFLTAAIVLFEIAAFQLNSLCFALSPLALAIILGYSYAKRFTVFAHLWLGLSLSIAPTAAWVAVRGEFHVAPLLLSLGVMVWTAGFDILYSLQDLEFDRKRRLFSIPQRFGVRPSLQIARLLHLAAVGSFVAAGVALGAAWPFFTGVAVVAALLAYEHTLVHQDDLSHIDTAFFTVNGYVSVAMLAFAVLDLVVRQ